MTRGFTISVNKKDETEVEQYLQNKRFEYKLKGSNKYGNQYKVFGDKTVEKEVRESLRRRQFS